MELRRPDIEVEASPHATADTDDLLRELEVARGREEHLTKQTETLEERLLEAETARATSEQETRRALDRIEELRATTSWRITAPVRAMSRLLGRR